MSASQPDAPNSGALLRDERALPYKHVAVERARSDGRARCEAALAPDALDSPEIQRLVTSAGVNQELACLVSLDLTGGLRPPVPSMTRSKICQLEIAGAEEPGTVSPAKGAAKVACRR